MSSNPNSDELEPGQKYGRTLGLTRTGDIDETALHRPEQLYDTNAVEQDLKVAILTPEGDDPFRPDFGLNEFEAIGTSDARFRAEIARTIGPDADPRVERVNTISIERNAGARDVSVTAEITLSDGQITEFSFPVQRREATRDPIQGADPP